MFPSPYTGFTQLRTWALHTNKKPGKVRIMTNKGVKTSFDTVSLKGGRGGGGKESID